MCLSFRYPYIMALIISNKEHLYVKMGYCFNIKMLYQHFSLVGFLAKLWYNSLLWNRGVRNINFAEIGSKVGKIQKIREFL